GGGGREGGGGVGPGHLAAGVPCEVTGAGTGPRAHSSWPAETYDPPSVAPQSPMVPAPPLAFRKICAGSIVAGPVPGQSAADSSTFGYGGTQGPFRHG